MEKVFKANVYKLYALALFMNNETKQVKEKIDEASQIFAEFGIVHGVAVCKFF